MIKLMNTNWITNRRRVRKENCPKETKYPCKNVLIPELRMTVKIKEGHTLEDWIINYCSTNPLAKRRLYPAYNIVE